MRQPAVGFHISGVLIACCLVAGSDAGHAAPIAEAAVAGCTVRASVNSHEAEGKGGGVDARISANGRFVAFESDARLVPGDTNGKKDVFVRDLRRGVTERVSVSSREEQAINYSFGPPAISANGRFVAFVSKAGNLVPNDDNRATDVFVRDRRKGVTRRVSLTDAGGQVDADSFLGGVSPRGRYVSFWSSASNLGGGADRLAGVFLRDRRLHTTERVSISNLGVAANDSSFVQTSNVSAGGRFVPFYSDASNLVNGDTNGESDVFVRDRMNDTTLLVSVNSAEEQSDAGAIDPSISNDGRYIVFLSEARNLAPNDAKRFFDVFLRDRQTGTTTLVSASAQGGAADQASGEAQISPDGRYVAFSSTADNLVHQDTNGRPDIFMRDLETGTNELVSISTQGQQTHVDSYRPTVSRGGAEVAFDSPARHLVPHDPNRQFDIFVRQREC